MLTDTQIKLIQSSWKELSENSQEVGIVFYKNLFQEAPELKPLFKSSPDDQAMKLMFMISYIVYRLDRLQDLKDEIHKLSTRHVKYGAESIHFSIVGKVLLETMAQQLKDSWNPETHDAWSATYEYISGQMIAAGSR